MEVNGKLVDQLFLKIWLTVEKWILKNKYIINVYGFVSVVSWKVL